MLGPLKCSVDKGPKDKEDKGTGGHFEAQKKERLPAPVIGCEAVVSVVV